MEREDADSSRARAKLVLGRRQDEKMAWEIRSAMPDKRVKVTPSSRFVEIESFPSGRGRM
jgi:hypothetical protein